MRLFRVEMEDGDFVFVSADSVEEMNLKIQKNGHGVVSFKEMEDL